MRRLSWLVIALLLALLAHRVWQSVGSKEEGHGHLPGRHGGMIVAIADDRYHVEAVFTRDGVLKLYTLGREETRVQEVEARTLTAHVTQEGDGEAFTIELRPEPQPGDGSGKTSCFSGRLPAVVMGRPLRVSVPNFRVDGARFHLAFARHAASQEPEMPAPVGEDEERQLYLVAGGRYTAADIEANGRQPASRKYQGFKARHDVAPKPGDRLCPVTRTKANAACTWVIGGRTYQFCCPPCIDEFVKQAKEAPEQVRDPETYLKP